MRSSMFTIAAALFAAGAFAQTPLGYKSVAYTSKNLGVKYGSVVLSPGEELSQTLVDDVSPSFYSNASYPNTYIIFLVDLDLPYAALETNDTSSLVPGLAANRTTRLHFWGGNYTQLSNGSFVNSSAPEAAYEGPQPPQGDIAHTYTFFMFNQPANYTPPAGAMALYTPVSTYNRMNFSVGAIVSEVGQPVAGNYMLVENINNTASANATATPASNATSSTNSSASATAAKTTSASVATYTGEAGRIVVANAALFAVGAFAFAVL